VENEQEIFRRPEVGEMCKKNCCKTLAVEYALVV
jgi:hypothetical protein